MVQRIPQRQGLATGLLIAGLLIVMLNLGGSWGIAYGQTAGPTPTAAPPALTLTKTVDNSQPRIGDEINFTLRVRNQGARPARQVVVTDDMPPQFQVIDATTSAGRATVAGQMVTVTIPELAPGETAVIVIRARVRDGAGTQVRNIAIARAVDVGGVAVPPQTGQAVVRPVVAGAGGERPAPGDGGNSGRPSPAQCAQNLQLSLTYDQPQYNAGDPVFLTVALANRQLTGVTNVVLNTNVPAELEIQSVTAPIGSLSQNGQALQVAAPSLQPGEALVVLVQGTARGTLPQPTGSYTTGEGCKSAGGTLGEGGERGNLPNGGAESPARWPLVALGLALIAVGGGLFLAGRRSSKREQVS